MKPVAKRFPEDIKRKYSTMDAIKKKELLSQPNEKLVKARSVELCINQFKRKIGEGLYFICTVCNRILYKKSVITCMRSTLAKHISIFNTHLMENSIHATHVIQRS